MRTLTDLINESKDPSYFKRIPNDTEVFLGKTFKDWDVMEQFTIVSYVNNPQSQFIQLQLTKNG